MREVFLNSLYILSKIPGVSIPLKVYYFFNASLASILLNKKEHKLIAIKGGYARKDYLPIVSDIDFIVVTNNYKPSSILRILCPLIKDIDVYGEEEFQTRLKYGSLKYSDAENWIIKKGELPNVNYFYYPSKIKLDVVEEIYFYYEWIFENLKNGYGLYRKACLLRTLKKVRELIPNLIDNGEKLALLNSIDFENIETIEKYLEKFIEMINFIETTCEYEPDQYVLENFSIGEQIKIEEGKIFLTKNMFNLFYGAGCINTYIILKDLADCDDRLLAHLQIIRYKLKLLDGKTNHIHEDLNDVNLIEKINKAQDTLKNIEVFNFQGLYQGKSVFVTASWGNDYLNRLLEAHKMNLSQFGSSLSYLHISLGGDSNFFEGVNSITTIRLENLVQFRGLWHKESLFNVAKNFIDKANIYIFSDIDAVIKDASWLNEIKKKLIEKDVIQPFKTFVDEKTKEKTYSSISALELSEDVFYAPGLMWAFNTSGIEKMGSFYDSFHDGSNDGVLFKEITKANIGMVEDLDWIAQKIEDYVSPTQYDYDYIDYEINHISHPLPKHYVNMILFFNLILPLLDKEIYRSDYGLWSWRDGANSKLQTLFAQFRKDRGYASFLFLDAFKLFVKEILVTKIHRSVFHLDDDKKISIESKKSEVAFFIGSELKDMLIYLNFLGDSMQSFYRHKIVKFDKDSTYSISLVVEAEKDLEEILFFNVSRLKLLDLKMKFKKINNSMWSSMISFYCWEEILDPLLELEFNLSEELELLFNNYHIEKVPSKEWEWVAEQKTDSQEITKIHHLKLDKKLAPKWYKLVLNLSNHNLEEYRVSVWDSFGENIYLPRIQKPANDHITLYFKTAFSIEFLKVKVECSIDVNFSYEMVLFQ